MNAGVFEALTRRASLATVGAAGLAALANPSATGKKKKKKKKGDVNKLCKQEVGDCIATLTPACEDAECVAAVQLCCPELATCDAAGFLACIVANA